MYYNGTSFTPDYSYASSKVRGASQSQTSSPPWSERSFEGTSPQRNPPPAPHMYPVPLPAGGPSTPERPYGLMTPPTSPTRSAAALHPLLVYDPSGRVLCDVSCDVSSIRLRPGVALTVLDEYASNPAATRMFINIPGSPWTFDITNARGVTIRDVLSMVCETMNYNVGNTEFQAFDQTIRNIASTSFQQRGGSNAGFKSGLRRFDFMGNNKFFVGLRKARDGFSWDANFAFLA